MSLLLLGLVLLASADAPLALDGSETRHEIAAPAVHRYTVALEKDQAARVRVLQEGIDLVVDVVAPDGSPLVSFDGPTGDQGPEVAEWVSASAGTYVVVVRPFTGARAGAYRVRAEPPRSATQHDRDLLEARQVLARGYARRAAFDQEGALADAQRALELLRRTTGPDALETADGCDLLGYVEDERSHYDAAVALFGEALAIRERAGADVSRRRGTAVNIAWVLLANGKYTEAEERFRVLAAQWDTDGQPGRGDDPRTGLAIALRQRGQSAASAALLRTIVARTEERLGPQASALDHRLRALGLALLESGQPADAEAACMRALALPRHSRWDELGRASDLECVGRARAAQKKDATEVLADALAVCTRLRGGGSLCAASVLEAQGEAAATPSAARVLFERSRDARAALLRPDHPDLVHVRGRAVAVRDLSSHLGS